MNEIKISLFFMVASRFMMRFFILLGLSIFSVSAKASCDYQFTGNPFFYAAQITFTNDGPTDLTAWDVSFTYPDSTSPTQAFMNGDYVETISSSGSTFTVDIVGGGGVNGTLFVGDTIVLTVQGGPAGGGNTIVDPPGLTGVLCGPAPTIVAMDDIAASPVNGTTGGTIAENVLSNDILNGVTPVNAADVNLTPVTTGPLTVNADGTVDVAAGTAAGTYTVIYEICEAVLLTNCASAEVTVEVFEPPVVAELCGGAVQIFGEDFGTGGPKPSSQVLNHTYTTSTPFDGFYQINDPANLTANFFGGGNLLDHTPGDIDGSALVINMLNAPVNFYQTTVTGITPNSDITFQAWVNGTCPGCPDLGELELIVEDINGNVIASSGTAAVPNNQIWNQRSFVFNSGVNTTLNIILRNAASSGSAGNDLLIDDIALCQDATADLTLVKVVDNTPGGGTAVPGDWTLEANIGGGAPEISGVSGISMTVDTGDYILSEINGPDGYVQTDLSCDSGVFDSSSSTLSLSPAEDVTCTFTNRDLIADLQIVKTFSPTNPAVNETVTFTLIITNNGPDPATNVVIDDELLSGFTFEANSMTGGDSQNQSAPNLQWIINNLPVGTANAVTLTYQAVVN